jgi:hypothetical protein
MTSSTNATPKNTSRFEGVTFAVPRFVATNEKIDAGCDTQRCGSGVPPHQPVAEPRRHREQQKDQQQHEGDVHRTQHLGTHDIHGGIQMEQAHPDEQHCRRALQPAVEPADRPFLFLD